MAEFRLPIQRPLLLARQIMPEILLPLHVRENALSRALVGPFVEGKFLGSRERSAVLLGNREPDGD